MAQYTNGAGTKEWLEAVKDIQLKAYIQGEEERRETAVASKEEEALFGTHLKEAIEVIRGRGRG